MELETRNFEFRGRWAVTDVERLHRIAFAEPEPLHRTVGDVQQWSKVGLVAVGQKQAVARNQADEMPKGSLDGLEIREDIGVIKFQVVDDRDFRQVVDKLAALVKEGGVVLIALDDEPFAVGE